MSEEQTTNTIRSQAGADDARLAERMKAIMEQSAPKPQRKTAGTPQKSKPDWLKSNGKGKSAAPKPEPAARPAKRKTSTTRPPKNSEESWKLAAENIARQQTDE